MLQGVTTAQLAQAEASDFIVLDDGALVRGDHVFDDVAPGSETRVWGNPLNNGYRTLIPGVVGFYSSPDPLHMQTQMNHLGPAVYAYAANRPFTYQDPDGRDPDGWESALAFGLVTPDQVAGYRTAALEGGTLGVGALTGGAAGATALTAARALWLSGVASSKALVLSARLSVASGFVAFRGAFDRLGGVGCSGGDSGRRTADAAEIFRRLANYHGIPEALSSDRLHAIKELWGRGAADNVLFDLTGNVFDPKTGEWLGSLTEGGGGR